MAWATADLQFRTRKCTKLYTMDKSSKHTHFKNMAKMQRKVKLFITKKPKYEPWQKHNQV